MEAAAVCGGSPGWWWEAVPVGRFELCMSAAGASSARRALEVARGVLASRSPRMADELVEAATGGRPRPAGPAELELMGFARG